nr:reverse transcriptase domain-containing protein [Tanacetum cinerariifolium]
MDRRNRFITGIPKVIKISSFMDAHKCLKLAKRCFNKVLKTVDEMMTRLDDFVRLEEAFASTELSKEEASEASRKSIGPVNKREDQFHRGGYIANRQRNERRSTFNNKDGLVLCHASDEPLIIEVVMKGYLVRRVYVDQGASVEVMFEHCFENLSPIIRSRLRGTQMDLVGFARGVDGLKIPPSGFLNNTLHGKVPEKDKIEAKTRQNQAGNGKRGKVNEVKAKVKVKPVKTGHGFEKSMKN